MRLLLSIAAAIALAFNSSAQGDTLRIYFDTDDPFLNRKALMGLNKSFLEVSGSNHVLVIGYADHRGDVYYNDMLSMRRAQSVAGFFEEKGLNKNNIRLVYGQGEIKRQVEKPGGYAEDRRVDVILLDKELPGPVTSTAYRSTPGKENVTKEKTLDDIETMKVGEALVLNNINFYLNSSRMMPQSQPSLNELYQVMKNSPGLSIQIEGHICCTTDNTGTTGEQAHQLSLHRAEAVYEFLLNKGIAKTRMRYAGFGRTRPKVAVENTETDRLQNRRVEIRILAK